MLVGFIKNSMKEAVITFQARMNALLRDRTILYYALPLSFVIWIFEILRVYVVFIAFGAKVTPILIGEVFILASFVGMVPLLPGGLGAIDGIMILFYSHAGITTSISAAATVVERLISFWMTTILGVIFLLKFGTSVLDKSFELAESKNADDDNVEISEEGKKVLKQLEEDSLDDDSKDESSDIETEEAVLEVLDDEEDKELLEAEIKN